MSVNLGSCIPLCPQVSGSNLRLLFLYGTRYARILAPGFPLDSGTNLRSTARAVGRHSRKSLTSLTWCLLTRGFTFPHSNSPLAGGILGDGQRAWPASMGRQVCRVSEVFVSTTALQEKRLILVLGSELSVFAWLWVLRSTVRPSVTAAGTLSISQLSASRKSNRGRGLGSTVLKDAPLLTRFRQGDPTFCLLCLLMTIVRLSVASLTHGLLETAELAVSVNGPPGSARSVGHLPPGYFLAQPR